MVLEQGKGFQSRKTFQRSKVCKLILINVKLSKIYHILQLNNIFVGKTHIIKGKGREGRAVLLTAYHYRFGQVSHYFLFDSGGFADGGIVLSEEEIRLVPELNVWHSFRSQGFNLAFKLAYTRFIARLIEAVSRVC